MLNGVKSTDSKNSREEGYTSRLFKIGQADCKYVSYISTHACASKGNLYSFYKTCRKV